MNSITNLRFGLLTENFNLCYSVYRVATQPTFDCSSPSGTDANFELVEVDIGVWQTDRSDIVRVGDWSREFVEPNVVRYCRAIIIWMCIDVGHGNCNRVWDVRCRSMQGTQCYLHTGWVHWRSRKNE